MSDLTIGIDFGTTNTAVARRRSGGTGAGIDAATELAIFSHASGETDVFRSILYFEQHRTPPPVRVAAWSGPAAIDHYLAAEAKGRLIQSLKSFLTSRTLTSTEVFGRRLTIESLIARVLRDVREQAEARFGTRISAAVVGRPVRFVGADSDDDNMFAEKRLREAFTLAGFEHVDFELEPVAAAHFYESSLDHDELILIGDFGGGTSDFTLIRVGPQAQRSGDRLLGNAGLGLAGDALDARIIRHLVSPALGAGTQLRSHNRLLPVPIAVYSKLERWHYLSLLKNRETLGQLERVRAQAEHPKKIDALIHLIASDLGYQLHRAVQSLKFELSSRESARFQFHDGVLALDAIVTRADFEGWIADELASIETCVDGLLASTGVAAPDVDRVFLTGGTSFVPAVKRIFESRFGGAKLQTGEEFTSVARGLAVRTK